MRVYLTPNQNAISIRASAADIAFARQLLDDLDRPRKSYRLTYTVATIDNGKRVGDQHYTLVLAADQRTTLKQGSRVPVITGSFDTGKQGQQTEFTYLDIGLNIDAQLFPTVNGARLLSKIEQSSLGEDKVLGNSADPVVRQTKIEGSVLLALGKPVILGSLDIPDSPRHLDISVELDLLP